MSEFNELFNTVRDGYNQGVSEYESDPRNPFLIMKAVVAIIVIGAIILQLNGVPVFHYLSVVWHWFAG